jgi:hypothetical protein
MDIRKLQNRKTRMVYHRHRQDMELRYRQNDPSRNIARF